jgi:anti-sigma-K factor RskA
MTPFPDIEDEIRRYLLGTLSEESRRGVEERLMTEEAFLEELTLAEGELVDDYVAGRLSPDERAAFERHFLSTEERRAQLRFTRAVGRYASAAAASAKAGETDAEREAATTTSTTASTTTAGPTLGERLRAFWGDRSAAWRAGFAFAAVATVAFAVWLTTPVAHAPRTFATLTLVAGAGERATGVEPPRVRLPPGTDALKVTLTLPAGTPPATAYRVELMTDKGRTEKVEVVGHDSRAVTVVIPEGRLARGRHVLRLFAAADGAERRVGDSYVFDVE